MDSLHSKAQAIRDKAFAALTVEQRHDCQTLCGFAIRCRVTFQAFNEAVTERMLHLTPNERAYVLGFAIEHLKHEI